MTLINPEVTRAVAEEVIQERARQDAKWGTQLHPVIGGMGFRSLSQERYQEQAVGMKEVNDYRVENGTLGWDTILLEEVYEAFAEGDLEKIREEMVQVAAVAVGIVEDIDRKIAARVAK